MFIASLFTRTNQQQIISADRTNIYLQHPLNILNITETDKIHTKSNYLLNSIKIKLQKIEKKMNKQTEASMNLPVHNHISRLGELIEEMRNDTNQAQKDLHILRGCISQLSFVNKQSDYDLNEYLLTSINLMRTKWAEDWDFQKNQLLEHHKKINKIVLQHQDIQLKREQLQEKVQVIQEIVGLI